MKAIAYHDQISQATAAGELHELRRQAETDVELTPAQRSSVCEAIALRFCKLNAAALPVQKGRW